jgi:hypothetical protein
MVAGNLGDMQTGGKHKGTMQKAFPPSWIGKATGKDVRFSAQTISAPNGPIKSRGNSWFCSKRGCPKKRPSTLARGKCGHDGRRAKVKPVRRAFDLRKFCRWLGLNGDARLAQW